MQTIRFLLLLIHIPVGLKEEKQQLYLIIIQRAYSCHLIIIIKQHKINLVNSLYNTTVNLTHLSIYCGTL